MTIDPMIVARLDEVRLAIAMLIEMHLPGETIRAWTGGADISWNGHVWRPDSRIVNLDKISTDIQGVDNKITFRMIFDPADATLTALRDGQGRGGVIIIDLLFFDAETNTPLGAEPCFIGEIDSCTLQASGKTLTLDLASASETALLRRSVQHMLTDGAQQALFPGDLGLQYATHPRNRRFGAGYTGVSGALGNAEQQNSRTLSQGGF